MGSTETVQSDVAPRHDRSIGEIVRLLMRGDSVASRLPSSARASQISRGTPRSSQASLWSSGTRSRSSSLAQHHTLAGRCHSRLRRSIDDSFMSHGALEREKAWYRNAKQRYDGMRHDSPFGTFSQMPPHAGVSPPCSFPRASDTSGASAASVQFAFEGGNAPLYRRSHRRQVSAGQQTPLSREQLSFTQHVQQQAALRQARGNGHRRRE